ncbi:hypothetical protein, partial [Streptomyces atratus]
MGHIECKQKKATPWKTISAVLLATVCAVGVPEIALSATAAAEGPASVEPSSAQQLSAEEEASSAATDSGNPVEVLSRRTETSQVFANPSGSFTQETYATAQWT